MLPTLLTHQLVEKAQIVLLDQLKESQTLIFENLSIKSNILKQKSQQHQILSIRLLQLQQDLVSQIDSQDKTLDDVNDKQHFETHSDELDEENFMLKKYRIQRGKCFVESNTLLKSIINIESYLSDIKDDALCTTVSTNKVNHRIEISETLKEKQDESIYLVTQQLDNIVHEIGTLSNDTITLRSKLDDLIIILDDLEIHRHLVVSEKKELYQYWKNALKKIGQKDELIDILTSRLKSFHNEYRKSCDEVQHNKRDIIVAQEFYDVKKLAIERIKKDISTTENKIGHLNGKIVDVSIDLSANMDLLTKLERDEKLLEAMSTNLISSVSDFQSTIPNLMERRHTVYAELQMVNVSKQSVTDTVKILNTKKERVLALSHKLDIDTFALEQEIDICLSTNVAKIAVLQAMDEQSFTDESDVREKERVIEIYRSNLKHRNELVEKTISRSEQLRKKFTALVEASHGEENLDTFDNRLKNLETTVDQVIEDCGVLERSWLSVQTELILLIQESEETLSQKRLLKAKTCVLTQQKHRYLCYLLNCHVDIKYSKQSTEKLQKEISKLNCSLSCHKERVLDTQSKCFSSKISHDDKMAELNRLSRESEERAIQVRDLTRELVLEIAEINDLTSRCEVNIQSMKEIRASDTLLETSEIGNDLELDLRNTSQRLDSARRLQISLCHAIETAVLKREEIARSIPTTSPCSSVDEIRFISKRISLLTSEVAEIVVKAKKVSESIESKVSTIEDIERQAIQLTTLIQSSSNKSELLLGVTTRQQFGLRILSLSCSSKLQYLCTLQQKRGKRIKHFGKHSSSSSSLGHVKNIVKEIRDSCGHLSTVVVETLGTMSSIL